MTNGNELVQRTPQQDASESRPILCEKHVPSGLTIAYPPTHLIESGTTVGNEPVPQYKTRRVMIDPRTLIIVANICREFRPKHSEELRLRFRSMGYSTEFGFISWTYNEQLRMKLCISGQHRVAAILKQYSLVEAKEADESTVTDFRMMETLEYYQDSEGDIPISDIVIMSAHANEKSGCVAKPSLSDKMGTLLNFLRLNKSLSGKSVSAIVQAVHKKSVLSGLKNRSLRRYVTVALMLKENRRAEEEFRRGANEDMNPDATSPGGMSLGILSSSILASCSPAAQLLGIICVKVHHSSCKASGRAGQQPSLTESSAGSFFKVVKKLFDSLKALSEPRDMDVYSVMDFIVAHTTNSEPQKASFFVAEQIRTWVPMDENTEKKWVEDVQRSIVTRMLSALPPKPTRSRPLELIDLDATDEEDSTRTDGEEEVVEVVVPTGEGDAGGGNAVVDETRSAGELSGRNVAVGALAEVEASGSVGCEGDNTSEEQLEPPHPSGDLVEVVTSPAQPSTRSRADMFNSEAHNNSPAKKRLKTRTRSQTAQARLVEQIEEGDIPQSTASPLVSTRVGNEAVARSNKRKKSLKPSKSQLSVEAARKRKEQEQFDDRVAELPTAVQEKEELQQQLLGMNLGNIMYDNHPGSFPLRRQHPSVSILGAEGYLKVMHHIVRQCRYDSAWCLFPDGQAGPHGQSFKSLLSGLADRSTVLGSGHEGVQGLLGRVHSSLFYDGFAVLDLFSSNIGGEAFPCPSGAEGLIDMKGCVDTLFDYYAGDARVPEKSGFWDTEFWNPITNVGSKEDINARGAGATRMFSPRRATNENMQRADMDVYKARLYLDLYLAAIADVLRLRTHTLATESAWWHLLDADMQRQEPLHLPNSGGRFILTGKNTLRQRPHCDFQQPAPSFRPGVPDASPSYFMMVSGADGFPLYVWKGSHREINHEPNVALQLSSRNIPSSVWVEPYCVLIGRGDLHHAGAGWSDWVSQKQSGRYKYSVRYHMYLKRDNHYLGNHVFDKYENVQYEWQD